MPEKHIMPIVFIVYMAAGSTLLFYGLFRPAIAVFRASLADSQQSRH
jgi:hypothetical protein